MRLCKLHLLTSLGISYVKSTLGTHHFSFYTKINAVKGQFVQIQLQNDNTLSTSKYTLCTVMFIWLVILINSLLLYTVVMWVNVGTRGTVVKNEKCTV